MQVRSSRKETMRVYREANKAKLRFQEAELRDKLRIEMVQAYGGKCLHCREDDPIVLTLDHINDDPAPEYADCGKSARGGHALYDKLRRQGWPKDRFQLLCFNCNMRKEHQRRRNGMVTAYGEPPPKTAPLSRGEARAKAGANTNNASGFKGVLWNANRQKWQAQFRAHGKLIFLGRFNNIVDAAKAYREGAKAVWGAHAQMLTDEQIEVIAAQVAAPSSEIPAEELGL